MNIQNLHNYSINIWHLDEQYYVVVVGFLQPDKIFILYNATTTMTTSRVLLFCNPHLSYRLYCVVLFDAFRVRKFSQQVALK